MTGLPKSERIADGKVRIAFTLPERLIGELDIEVARQKIAGNWIRRNVGFEAALRRFFDDGRLAVAARAHTRPCLVGKRRHMTTHLDYDLVGEMKRQIIEQDAVGVFWQPWQVVALAVDHFLRTGGFEAADQSDADQRPVG